MEGHHDYLTEARLGSVGAVGGVGGCLVHDTFVAVIGDSEGNLCGVAGACSSAFFIGLMIDFAAVMLRFGWKEIRPANGSTKTRTLDNTIVAVGTH